MIDTKFNLLKTAISEILHPSRLENTLRTTEDTLCHSDFNWMRGSTCYSEVTDILDRLTHFPEIESQSFKVFKINPRFKVVAIKSYERILESNSNGYKIYIWMLFFYRQTLFTVAKYTLYTDTNIIKTEGYGEVVFQHKEHHTATTIKYSILVRDILLTDGNNNIVFNMNLRNGSLFYNLYYPDTTIPFLSVSNVKGISIRYGVRVEQAGNCYTLKVLPSNETYLYSVIPNLIKPKSSSIPLIRGFI